jgi:hypothetical protein
MDPDTKHQKIRKQNKTKQIKTNQNKPNQTKTKQNKTLVLLQCQKLYFLFLSLRLTNKIK